MRRRTRWQRGEAHREGAPLTRPALDADPAAMLGHDPVRHGEAEAHVAPLILRREERLEDARQVLGRDPLAVVSHDDAHLAVLEAGRDPDLAAGPPEAGGAGVREEVQE